ncbi:MAG: rhodanese-like domain-containing protein [Eudoraea sp.]|uniref:sulfurtransferase n=1 Tax=Eudoraea sp. TaxID=1979955 RepID=UPI003C76EF95
MSSKISISALLYILFLSCNGIKEKPIPVVSNYASTENLIEAEELLSIFKDENIKIVDFRNPESYNNGRIHRSLNIWRTDISDNSYPYPGMRSDKENIELLFGKIGISNEDLIVVYDDKGSADASRLWCLLKNYDFESIKILNGGLKSWESIGGKLSIETFAYPPSHFYLPKERSEKLWINKNELIGLIKDEKKNIIIIDSRSYEEYSGNQIKKGASKGGRIPKSIHIDWAEAVDMNGSKKFRSIEELQKIYKDLEMNAKDTVIVYCHTGYRSSLTTFVLRELMGFENVWNYDGSWVEWSYFDELPYEKDSIIL